jgi:integrase
VFPLGGNAINRWLFGAKLPGVSAHVIRHTYASESSIVCAIDDVSRLLGHRLPGSQITANYTHRGDGHMIACANLASDRIQALCEGRIGKVLPLRIG